MTIKVKVTNTGSVAGKEVVQIYGHSPYFKGGVEKTENVLLAFDKTATLNPGQSETVTLTVNIQDMASFDWSDANGNGKTTYELDANATGVDSANHVIHDSSNNYELRLQGDSHNVLDTYTLAALTNDIILSTDDYSGNEVESLFTGDDMYNTLSYDYGTGKTLVEEGKMTLLSRSDFEGTWPEIATKNDMTRSDEYFESVDAFAEYEADNTEALADYLGADSTATEDNAGFAWSITELEFKQYYGVDWKQLTTEEQDAQKETGDWLNYSDMATVDVHNTTVKYQNTDPTADCYTTNTSLVGLTGEEAWTKFMNQLTWDEMKNLCNDGTFGTAAVESVNREHSRYMDGPTAADQEMSDTFNWGDVPHWASTWNKDLQYRKGVIVACIGMLDPIGEGLDGWYAPACNLLRSPFTGRTAEYYSEDPVLTGELAGNMVQGGADNGMVMTMKHVALNESETQRQSLHTYLTEQCGREIYYKAFQIVIQNYNCRSIMGSYNCIGEVFSSANYQFTNALVRQEWGFEGNACTDAVGPNTNFFSMDSLVRGGTNLTINPVDEDSYISTGDGDCILSGTYSSEDNCVYLDDGEVCYTQWYWVRTSAFNILYSEVNMHSSHNGGVDMTTYSTSTSYVESDNVITITQGESIGASSGGSGFDSMSGGSSSSDSTAIDLSAAFDNVSSDKIVYSVVDGSLPDGLTLNSDGNLEGAALTMGTYTFTVEARAYGWLTGETQFTLVVESAFTADDDISNYTVGDYVDIYLESEVYSAADYTDENDWYIISVADGSSLPKGLTLTMDDNGNARITGTLEESGTITTKFTLSIRDENTSVNFAGVQGETTIEYTTIDFEITFSIKSAASTGTLTEEDVQSLIDSALSELDTGSGLTEAQVQEIVDTALANNLTEEDVQELIDTALASTGSGCSGNIAANIATVASLCAVAAVVSAVAIGVRRKNNKS